MVSDEKWVKNFIHDVLNCDLDSQAEQLRERKLNYINLPLYKYCYVCENAARTELTVDYNIENFKNDMLYFQTPDKFNDPFDCYLGFSQIQLIRDLLLQEMRRRKQLTPEVRKAIYQLFDAQTSIDIQSLPTDNLIQMATSLFSLLPDSDPLKDFYIEFFTSLFSADEKLVRDLMQNRLTIRDKQKIADAIWGNPRFIKSLEGQVKPENLDFVLRSAPHDMKINIENNPDSFLSDNSGETFGVFDFISLFAHVLDIKGLPADEVDAIKIKFNSISREFLSTARNIISNQFRITCLSERMDSPLMWSHYANKHYGFCLEYDFTPTITAFRYPDLLAAQLMLYPVNYSADRPLLSKAIFGSRANIQYIRNKTLPPDFIENLLYGLLFKSADWEYEKEWRIFQIAPGSPTMKLPKARKVYLGANIEMQAKDRIVEIAKQKHIPVFQMFLHGDRYKFDYYQIK